MSDRDRMEFDGTVEDFSNGKFVVRVSEGYAALCTLSGKIRLNDVKILLGDLVRIEVSPYDVNKGRIIFRSKAGP